MDPRTDESVRRARSGDPRAFRILTEILAPDLIRYLTVILNGDTHAAHDVAQEVFLCAWDAREQFEGGQHLRRWCYRVGRYRAVSWIRRRRPGGRRVESLEALDEDGLRREPTTEGLDVPERTSDHPDLVGALRRLPPQFAGPVHLYYLQGLSTQETADLLGLNHSALKMRLLRARAFLRRELHPHDRRPEPEPAPDAVGDTTP